MKISLARPKRKDVISAASLASMIDIIFLLLIFFIVTASFDYAQLDQQVDMPEISNRSPVKTLPPERLIINILASGDVRIGYHEVQHERLATDLKGVIASRLDRPDIPVILSADRNCRHRYVADAMTALAALGLQNVQINAKVAGNNGE